MAHIVVGVDGSPTGDRALRWAVEEAGLRGTWVELVLGYVMQTRRAPLARSNLTVAEQTLDEIIERKAEVLQHVKWTSTLTPLLGAPYADAVLEAGEHAALIVVGSRGLGGFGELLLGSTSYKVAAHAPVPAVVVRAGDDGGVEDTRRIVVGVDTSRAAIRALQWAVDEAAVRVDVAVVHDYYTLNVALLAGVASSEQISTERARARDEGDLIVDAALDAVTVPDAVTISRKLVTGTPAAALLGVAAPADMIVVGTRGMGGVRRVVVGSTSHQILHHASGPVVVVP